MNRETAQVRLTVDELSVDRNGVTIATLVDADGSIVTMPVSLLPQGIAVNQVVVAEFKNDPDATTERVERVRNLQHRLFNRE